MRESNTKLPYEIPNVEVLYILADDVVRTSAQIDKEGGEDASDFFN